MLAVITARGGSKGLPGKNLAPLAGRPLVAWTIGAALAAQSVDRVILTTDSEEIANVGRRFGAEVPFKRPAYLARDRSHTPDVVEHAVAHLEKHEGFVPDVVVTLQPTSPFRGPDQIDEAVRILIQTPRLDSVISVGPSFPPQWMFFLRGGRLAPFVADGRDYSLEERQELPTVYQPNGAVYVTRRLLLRDRGLLFSAFSGGATGYLIMDAVTSVDIDDPIDLVVARALGRDHPQLLAWASRKPARARKCWSAARKVSQ